ncbi:hypothetical protein D3C76_436320 [compost metagenome]
MMFDFYSWHPGLRFFFMLVPFVIGLSGLAIGAYTTHHDLEKMKAVFPKSLCIANSMRLWAGFSFSSRMMQASAIAGAVLWPKPLIRSGGLDPEELRNFPADLKRRLAISMYLTLTGLAWLFLAVGLLKFTED